MQGVYVQLLLELGVVGRDAPCQRGSRCMRWAVVDAAHGRHWAGERASNSILRATSAIVRFSRSIERTGKCASRARTSTQQNRHTVAWCGCVKMTTVLLNGEDNTAVYGFRIHSRTQRMKWNATWLVTVTAAPRMNSLPWSIYLRGLPVNMGAVR